MPSRFAADKSLPLSTTMLASGYAYLSGGMDAAMIDYLGYPAHFVLLLGTWKLLVAPGLLIPGVQQVKDLAYAGLFFTFTGAAWAHITVGDGGGEIAAPLVMLTLAATSWWFQGVRGVATSPAGSAVPAK